MQYVYSEIESACTRMNPLDDTTLKTMVQEFKVNVDKYTEARNLAFVLFDKIRHEMGCEKVVFNSQFTYGEERNFDELLAFASSCGNVDIVQLCIENNGEDALGDALLIAVQHGHVDVVKLLLAKGYYIMKVLHKAKSIAFTYGRLDIMNVIDMQINTQRYE